MRLLTIIVAALMLSANVQAKKDKTFVTVDKTNLVKPNGEKLFILGTNLGNWLNPEGYMFGLQKTSSYWMIDQAIAQMVGPDATADFWKAFKENYITRDDIAFIASTGSNTVRLPFNYKLFTDEDYMGLTAGQDGFAIVDKVVGWCKEFNLYLILDMHDCPGGQTGDNIDNSYGYPWLFESERSQQLFCDVWKKIAQRYKDEPVILGYELMNEPIAHYFDNKDVLNQKLEPLYKRAVRAIREVDTNHIILLGGAQWNGSFEMFTDWTFDNKIMYTCHRYGGSAKKEAFMNIIDFRDKTQLPMYMGETGHNSDEWQAELCQMMRDNNIGYTFWPYKKPEGSCMNAFQKPALWDSIVVRFAEGERARYDSIRSRRPDPAVAQRVLNEYLENCRYANCTPQKGYIRSMGLKAE
ncbi:MAG: glycoside hydrolase family 5 protein [Bacteroidaceae bacterium]|nr:glycoside hydrolase family 5 protein [Bacteroidaceae bacterium]